MTLSIESYALIGDCETGSQLVRRRMARSRCSLADHAQGPHLCTHGLLSEEYDPLSKRQLGNFPQAFSHLALVGTALNLGRSAKPVQQRGTEASERRHG